MNQPVPLNEDRDASRWADEFRKTLGENPHLMAMERDWLIGWFANAIMCGYDSAKREILGEAPRATPEHLIETEEGYDTTVGNLRESRKLLYESNKQLTDECHERGIELERLEDVMKAAQGYLPKKSVAYLLLEAALDGSTVTEEKA